MKYFAPSLVMFWALLLAIVLNFAWREFVEDRKEEIVAKRVETSIGTISMTSSSGACGPSTISSYLDHQKIYEVDCGSTHYTIAEEVSK